MCPRDAQQQILILTFLVDVSDSVQTTKKPQRVAFLLSADSFDGVCFHLLLTQTWY